MGNKFKTIGIIISIPLAIILSMAIAFYLIITFTSPNKLVDWTVNVSALANVADDNNCVIYVEYYSNKNGNGVELLDIKINGYIDANQINSANPITYAKGIQFVGTDYMSIDFNQKTRYKHDTLSVIFGTQQETYKYVTPNVNAYYYDTQNGISFASAEDLSAEDIFRISIQNGENTELYLMKLLGEDGQSGETVNAWWMTNVNKTDYDVNYLAKILLDTCRTNDVGLDSEGLLTKSMGDIFQYKTYSNGVFGTDWLTSYDLKDSNIIVNFTNNVTIHITTHSDGATKSKDSMFGIIEDKNDFEYIIEGVANDYFNGTQIISLNENNFDCINVVGNKYTLKLNKSTIVLIKEEKNKPIEILIDLDILENNNVVFSSFDSSLSEYKERIQSIMLKQTLDTGEIQYTEVTL